jgi:hypothetical protein
MNGIKSKEDHEFAIEMPEHTILQATKQQIRVRSRMKSAHIGGPKKLLLLRKNLLQGNDHYILEICQGALDESLLLSVFNLSTN